MVNLIFLMVSKYQSPQLPYRNENRPHRVLIIWESKLEFPGFSDRPRYLKTPRVQFDLKMGRNEPFVNFRKMMVLFLIFQKQNLILTGSRTKILWSLDIG